MYTYTDAFNDLHQEVTDALARAYGIEPEEINPNTLTILIDQLAKKRDQLEQERDQLEKERDQLEKERLQPHEPHGLDAMRVKIQKTLSILDEGMLKKIIAMLNAPVSFEYRDYSRAAEVKVTIVEGQVTWHVKGTLWQIGRAVEGVQAGKPVEATFTGLTIMELCESEIGEALCLTYEEVMRGLGWTNWGETLYGLPPHADDAIHRLTKR